ncbi:MAG TPA: hypothetical protein PK265_02200 [Candidatus Saccharibacteria bacterium]|nr:hypothetical protein [Candidatus Saccharibacteria bacterium]HRQ98115.1 hypothetical protein [Candidatus Saccharibacteria bacterium]
MDPTEQDFGTIHSADLELERLMHPNLSFDDFATNLVLEFRHLEHFKPNLYQMERTARLIGLSEESSSETMKYFYLGELTAFKVLQQINPDNHQNNYQALSALYDFARLEAENEINDKNFLARDFDKFVGLEINRLVENDFCFQAISLQEQEMLARIYVCGSNDVSLKDERYFDFTRGYRLGRMVETWYKSQLHIEALEDQELTDAMDVYNDNNAKNTDISNEAVNFKFHNIMHSSNFEQSYAEFLQPCTEDLTILSDKLTQHIAHLDNPDIYDPEATEYIQAKLTNLITNDFIQLENLKYRDDVTITGNLAAIIHDTNNDQIYIYPISESSTIRGSILEVDIIQTPKQSWVDRAVNNDSTKLFANDINPYGLVVVLDLSEISHADRSFTKTLPSERFLLAVEYSGVQIWRDPFSQVNS